MKVIFLGTPDFSVPSLEAIIQAGFDVVAVVTAPDKPAGRGMKLQESAVKKFAVAHHIQVLQPVKLKDPAFIEQLRELKADIQVVIAFRMLPEVVWNMPPKGTINLHASLLPNYRGAAPINWAIINGETETGVSTFLLKHEIDTGDLVLSEKVAIPESMNAGQLHDKLMQVGASVIVTSLQLIESGNYTPIPQGSSSTKIAPKIFTADCMLNWNDTSLNLYNKIRGLSPYPGAITSLNGKIFKVYAAEYSLEESDLSPGEMISDNKHFLKFRTRDGFISTTEIQLEGKKRMSIQDFLKGYSLT
ncbi:MAG: methionyl-tRNA formyltransferase [Bacteroidota bacterium]